MLYHYRITWSYWNGPHQDADISEERFSRLVQNIGDLVLEILSGDCYMEDSLLFHDHTKPRRRHTQWVQQPRPILPFVRSDLSTGAPDV